MTLNLPLQSLALSYAWMERVPFARHVALSMSVSALLLLKFQARMHLPARRWWCPSGLAAQPFS